MQWEDFRRENIEIDKHKAVIVCPNVKANGKWALKTEYPEAFPDVQTQLLNLGYHIAYVKNYTRWCVKEDIEAKAALAVYMNEKLGLSKKCAVIGMSCGGLHGIYFAAEYPQYVSCMYLDAPVVNLLSCPAGLGAAGSDMLEEFIHDTGINITALLSYRNHPLDKLPALIKNNIPIILVCGGADTVVPYEENGRLINEAYLSGGCKIKTIIKPECNHHPHGLEDNSPIINFITEHDIV